MRKATFALTFILLCKLGIANPGRPIVFIENKGQWPGALDFAARVPGGNLAVSAGLLSFTFLDMAHLEMLHERGHHGFQQHAELPVFDEIDAYAFSIALANANKSVPQPFGVLPGYRNYFQSADSCRWQTGVHLYTGVIYPNIYHGIDWKVYAQGNNLKYDYVVAPGADASQIAEQLPATLPTHQSGGDVVMVTPLGEVITKKPIAYQFIAGERIPVDCRYQVRDNVIRYHFPEGYDSCYELIIDPLLIFSTYSGSTADNWGSTATPGENGTLYSAGVVINESAGSEFTREFPVTEGAFQVNWGGLFDVGILKYDSTGSQLLYASYLGGAANESAHSLIVNEQNELIVLGTTGSFNFPTTVGAFDRTFNGGIAAVNVISYDTGSDIFIARISGDGRQLLASTYLGGSANDGLNPSNSPLAANYGDELRGDIITDAAGDIYISTVTASSNFPALNSFNTVYQGGSTDALILKIDRSLSNIIWSAFLGGNSFDASHTIKFDKGGNLFVAGGTTSIAFPTTLGVYQPVHAGGVDGWITSLANDGSAIIASTFTGTTAFNEVYFIDLNSSDEVFVYGQTVGPFPITAGTYRNPNSGQFVQKFSHDLTQLSFSTVFGSGRGVPDISPTAFLVNECNNLYMTGWGGAVNSASGNWPTDTNGMPVSADAFQRTTSGSDFYFIVLNDDATEFLYGTYLGGASSRTHVDGGTSRFDKSGIVYHAVCSGCAFLNGTNGSSSDFPTTPDAWSRINRSDNCNNAAFKFDLSSLLARLQTNNVTLTQPGFNRVCIPDAIVFQNRSIGGTRFFWNLGDGTRLNKSDTSVVVHQYQGPGRYLVTLTAFDNGTCRAVDSTRTVVDVFLPSGQGGADLVICTGASATLTATGGVNYNWTSLSGEFTNQTQFPTVAPNDTTLYRVQITDVEGCVVTDTVQVAVVPDIDFQFEWRTILSCAERSRLEVTNLTAEDETTFWNFGDGTISDAPNEIHEYAQDHIYNVRLVGTREFCVYEEAFNVPIFTLRAPNVITPDQSPGQNDRFVVQLGDEASTAWGVKVKLVVVNRWGETVFKDDDYQNTWNGGDLAAGVYFYEVEVEGYALCKDWLQIIR